MAERGLRVLAVTCLLDQAPLVLRAGAWRHEVHAIWAHVEDGLRAVVSLLHHAIFGPQRLISGRLKQIGLPCPGSGGEAGEGSSANPNEALVQILDRSETCSLEGFLTHEVGLIEVALLGTERKGVSRGRRHEEPLVIIELSSYLNGLGLRACCRAGDVLPGLSYKVVSGERADLI